MLKLLAAGATALFVTLSQAAFAQAPSTMGPASLSPQNLADLTDARVAIVKAVLQLTPDQEKYWPAIEDAIRAKMGVMSEAMYSPQSMVRRCVPQVGANYSASLACTRK